MNYKDFQKSVKVICAKVAKYAALPLQNRPVAEMRNFRKQILQILLAEVEGAPANFGRDPAFKALGNARTELSRLYGKRVIYEVG